MTPETKATAIEALRSYHDELLWEGRDKWDLLPLERKYHQGRNMTTRGIQRRRIAAGLRRVRAALREFRHDSLVLPRLDCE